MANTFKYNLSTETQALRKGNFWIGANDVPKPTDTTGFWHGITPPFSGYSIYLNKASNGPAIYVVDNDAELVSLTNRIGNLALTSVTQSLNYYATQSDKMILNRDYEPIVTSGLTLCLDAGFTPSYQGSGTTWYDLGFSGSNGTLTNGPSYSGSNGGTIILDGTNDFINIPYTGVTSDNFTFTIIMKSNTMNSSGINRQTLFGLSQNGNFAFRQFDVEIWGNNGQGFRGNGGPTENVDFFGYSWTLGVDANNINIYTITLNSSGQTIYVNGQLRNVLSQPYVSNFNSITLGVRGGGGQFWNGQCYHFNVYDRLLSNQEILQNYNAQKSRFGL